MHFLIVDPSQKHHVCHQAEFWMLVGVCCIAPCLYLLMFLFGAHQLWPEYWLLIWYCFKYVLNSYYCLLQNHWQYLQMEWAYLPHYLQHQIHFYWPHYYYFQLKRYNYSKLIHSDTGAILYFHLFQFYGFCRLKSLILALIYLLGIRCCFVQY